MLGPGAEVGGYVVEEHLGTGGMASVYRVRHRVLHSVHALKVLRADLVDDRQVRDRFLDEGRLQANLRHSGLVRVTSVVSEPGVAGLVMDFLDGEDLSARIARDGALPTGTATTWMLQALDAVGYAHAAEVVHRDLKPSNLYLERCEDGSSSVRVLDFGIAKVLGRHRTQSQASIGTCAYMSPEQIQEPRSVDHRTDIFALGAVLYEMVTGQEAFGGTTEFETMTHIVRGRYPPLREAVGEVPPELADAIARALAVEPEDRFQDCAAFGEAIRPLAASPHHVPRRPTPAPKIVPPTVVDRSDDAEPPDPSPRQTAPEVVPAVPPADEPSGSPLPVREREVVEPDLVLPRLPAPPRSLRLERHLAAQQAPDPWSDGGTEVDRAVYWAGVFQLFSGVLDLLLMWLGACIALGSLSAAIANAFGLPGWLFGAVGCASLLLLPLGLLEVISGLQALMRGRRGRTLVLATAWAEVASLAVGGLTAGMVGIASLLLLRIREGD